MTRNFKVKGLSADELEILLPPNVILLGYRGSIAHGMYVPNTDPNSIDDKDLMGVAMAPQSVYLGLDNFEQKEKFYQDYDCVTYEFKKYVRLLCNGNPNVLSLLWLNREHYIYHDAWGDLLIKHRDLFATRRMYHSFTGYAYAQLKRMTHGSTEGYMGEKRKALVAKYGFDVKNAAHCIRLLRMGIEFLNEGVLHVCRPDAAQLLQIKHGEWTMGQVQREAEGLFKRAQAAYDKCALPRESDMVAVNAMVMEIVKAYLSSYTADEFFSR